jgi:hypothetical protein
MAYFPRHERFGRSRLSMGQLGLIRRLTLCQFRLIHPCVTIRLLPDWVIAFPFLPQWVNTFPFVPYDVV